MNRFIALLSLVATAALAAPNSVNHDYAHASSFRDSLDVARGDYRAITVVHKFGRNEDVGTTVEPIALGGFYQTPTTAQSLEILSDDVDDTAAGAGARTVYVQGLDANWELQDETVSMDGTTPVALANTYIRVFRAYVATSGTYGTATAGSHQGKLTIRNAGAGVTWLEINDIATFPKGQSQVAVYTVPVGYTAYIQSVHIHVEASKPASLYLFRREDADVVSAPFSAIRLVQEWDGVDGAETWQGDIPFGPFNEKSDVGFMGKVASTSARVSIDYEIILVEN